MNQHPVPSQAPMSPGDENTTPPDARAVSDGFESGALPKIAAAISAAGESEVAHKPRNCELPSEIAIPLRAAHPDFSIEWAAGFVDGEACIHIAKQIYKGGRRATHQIRLHLSQNNLAVLEHFQRGMNVPSKIYAVKRRAQHRHPVFTLNYDGRHAMRLIAMLAPFLVRKWEEVKAAFEFWVEGRCGVRFGPNGRPPEIIAIRERLYWKLRSLK